LLVAIDIGGTFTDLMAFDKATGRFAQAKSLTTPTQLVQGIIDCLRMSGVDIAEIAELIHGSTTAINTLIERKGAKTGLIRHARDARRVLHRPRNRPESYNLLFHRHRPLVPRHLTGRSTSECSPSGEVLEPLERASLEEACRRLGDEKVEAVAVCFLHSYVNPEHERAAGEIVRRTLPEAYVSLPRDTARIPGIRKNLHHGGQRLHSVRRSAGTSAALKASLAQIGFRGDLTIMQSNGGVMTPEVATERRWRDGIRAGRRDHRLRANGTRAGLRRRDLLRHGRHHRQGELDTRRRANDGPGLLRRGYASGHPVMVPVIDVVEVGAGGGSIAWIDEIGALKVGPQSAGADPGPICYRGGGTEPTITDANLVLGRLDPEDSSAARWCSTQRPRPRAS